LLFECWQTHALLDVHLLNEVKALHLQHIKGFDFESTTLGTMIEVRLVSCVPFAVEWRGGEGDFERC
jgi:hypothetical protein